MEFGESKGEEEVAIKLQDYKIKTLIAIHGEMKEEFVKFAKAKKNEICIRFIDVYLKMID